MKLTTTQSLLLALIAWFSIKKKACTAAFVPSQYYSSHPTIVKRQYTSLIRFAAPDETTGDDSSNNQYDDDSKRVPNDLGLDIVRGSPSEISDDMWDDIEGGAPSRWMVMKDLLGINIFTYILGVFIIFFLSMNAMFGPGWLGQSLGWEDVGTFTRVSDSLPLNVDVSKPDYLL